MITLMRSGQKSAVEEKELKSEAHVYKYRVFKKDLAQLEAICTRRRLKKQGLLEQIVATFLAQEEDVQDEMLESPPPILAIIEPRAGILTDDEKTREIKKKK